MKVKGLSPLDLKIEHLPIAVFQDNPLNPRRHPPRQIKALARAITQFGFVRPVLIDRDNMIIAGHARLAAARFLAMTSVAAIRIAHLTPAEQRALMLADNKISDMSSFNEELLLENFRLLQIEDISLDLEVTGFAMGEIDLLHDKPAAAAKPDPDDDVPEAAGDAPPVNRVGDLWQLGGHRLACGSALEPETWRALMGGEKAAMSISDVPYNVKIAGHVSGLGKIKHQDFVMASGELDRDEFTAFLEMAFRHLAQHSVPGSLHYTFIDWRALGEMRAAGDAA